MPTLFTPDASAPALPARDDVTMVTVGSARWRVLDRRGRAVGHLDAVVTPSGARYRAGRYHPASRTIRAVGEFWSADDAIDCLRRLR